jgi:sporulation protein YlmC with PRC-barrel domain
VSPDTTSPDKAAKNSGEFRFLYFSELFRRKVRTADGKKVGRVDDLVFSLKETFPEALGILVEHGVGQPTEFIPWKSVRRIEPAAIVVDGPGPGQAAFAPFVDQPGWMLVDRHLMGRTILDIDGRRVEAVNDVQLLESNGRMVVVHVDTSLNGFFRKWGLSKLSPSKDRFISWKYVQPLNVEDAVATDVVSLSVAHKQLVEMPSEDLADALEELSGKEQEALFGALDSEKAAETLVEAEPRVQRQLVARMRKERAGTVLSEMSVPQLANLFGVLPLDHVEELEELLPPETRARVQAILSVREVPARALMSPDFLAMPPERTVREALDEIRRSGREPHAVSYVYIVGEAKVLMGVVDLRELVVAKDDQALRGLMRSPVISVEDKSLADDLEPLFVKYHFRMMPVVDAKDCIVGVIRYNDVMTSAEAQAAR